MSLSALLGRIFSRGTELELQGGIDFLAPLSATPNLETKRIEIEVSDPPVGVDVRAYGTVGTADDSGTLAAALTAAGEGGTVIIPAGVTVTVENVTVTSRTIRGPGTLKYKANATLPMLLITGADCCLGGLRIDGDSANQSGDVVAVALTDAPRFLLENARVESFRYKFLLTDPDSSPGGAVRDCSFVDCCQATSGDILGIRSSRWSITGCDFDGVTAAGHMIRFGHFDGSSTTPIVDSRVEGCSFYDSAEVGVVCELYTQGIEIVGNTFRELAQGVKCESAGDTVSGVNIIGNEFRDIALSTAFNWKVPGTFIGNRCYDCAGGIELGGDAIVEGNYLENCGSSSEGAIHLGTGWTGRWIIANNQIVSPVGSGIVIGSNGVTCTGNQIYDVTAAGKYGIDLDKAGHIVSDNVIDTVAAGATAMRLVSTCTESTVCGNKFRNLTGSGLSVSNSANLLTVLIKDNVGVPTPALLHTIATGAFSVGLSSYDCPTATEGAAASDDLDTMTPVTNLPIGHIVVLRDNSSSNDVTVKHGTGNIQLAGAADFAMADSSHRIALMWSGTFWQELWRN